jgi:hypothetical protein
VEPAPPAFPPATFPPRDFLRSSFRQIEPQEERNRMKKGNITRFKLVSKKPPKTDWRAFDAMSEAAALG